MPGLSDYETRVRRVYRHIFDNPTGDLSLDALADVAAMSRFHWHRVFHAMTGETCAQAVRRVRAHRAAVWLVQTDWPVAEIAARTGHDNAQSFARAFRARHGMTPLAFRAAGRPSPDPPTPRTGDRPMPDVEIRTLPPMRLAALAHRGPYAEIGRAFAQVAAVFSAGGHWAQARGMVAVYLDSPADVPAQDLRSEAGIVVDGGFALPSDLHAVTLPGGRHAVLTLKGPYSGLPAAWDALYAGWLPRSGEEPADSPPFEVYRNDPTDTAPEDLLTEICMPLA